MAEKKIPDSIDLLRRMWVIRAFEEKLSALYAERQVAGLLHLGIGQEAVAVGVCGLLRTDDLVYGGHRSHGHAIAKGADINRLMAEIAGRATGYCGGKGGSMHIVAKECGFITATGVVGGTIPLALGAAFAAKEGKKGQLAVVFFGDGAGQGDDSENSAAFSTESWASRSIAASSLSVTAFLPFNVRAARAMGSCFFHSASWDNSRYFAGSPS